MANIDMLLALPRNELKVAKQIKAAPDTRATH